MKTLIRQFIKFGIVGITNTIIGYLTYAISLQCIRYFHLWTTYDIYISQFIMFAISVLWSFFWNNKYVFYNDNRSKKDIVVSLLKTYASYAFTSLFLSELLLYFWIKCLTLNEYIAPVLSLVITVPLNFFIQKFWVFSRKP